MARSMPYRPDSLIGDFYLAAKRGASENGRNGLISRIMLYEMQMVFARFCSLMYVKKQESWQ